MKTVTVNASKQYDIKIAAQLLPTIGEEVKALGNVRQVCIVSDTNVWPLYGQTVQTALLNAGFLVCSYVFPAGEASKNGIIYLDLVNELAKQRLTRSDLLVALGGGVVGDLCGFVAATYLRGIRFMQLPTTLLAAVDSSVGGKTAIDLLAGKNLCGAFCQPSLVLCDTDTFSSLPREIFLDGCAEVIKYGILYDEDFFAYLEETGPDFDIETVVARCVELKRDVVMEDEFDTGARMKLNLGHTFGHGIEAISNFSVSHGKAVAIGMAMAARCCACPDTERIVACLEKFQLPVHAAYAAQDIFEHALSDKKRSGSTVNLILPRRIGHCDIVPTPVEHMKTLIKEGL